MAVGEVPIGVNMHQKGTKTIWGMFKGIDRQGEASGGETVPQRGANSISERNMCEGRGNRGSAPIGGAPDSVRGLTRAQYPSRVN